MQNIIIFGLQRGSFTLTIFSRSTVFAVQHLPDSIYGKNYPDH